nr:glutathione S-transferase family protein [uncultured Sphingomonas sp.]
MKIIGSFVSPYVRKVLAVMEWKGIAYEVDPITPFFGNDDFERLSPLRRIPVLIDGDFVLNDSSVICAYLEDIHPSPATLPADPRGRARARWFEEYADSRLGEVCIWDLFYQKFVRPMVWKEEGDQQRIDQAINIDLPRELTYLEGEIGDQQWLCGEFGLADISVASFFRNAAYAGCKIDGSRWPQVAAWLDRCFAQAVFDTLFRYESIQLSADIKGRRQALTDAGVRLTDSSMGLREPRRGVMQL